MSGIRAGDVITQAESARVITPADLQFVLNTIPDPGSVTLNLLRDGKPLPPAKLTLPAGWRKTDISWRPSQGGIAPQLGLWAEPLTPEQKRQRGIDADKLGLRVSFFFPSTAWAKTRGDIQMNDVIIGLNGKTLPSMTTRQFHTYFRLNNEVGDTAVLTVLRGSEKREISVPCMEVLEE
jgi:serine protease Do